jgi:NAD(P)H-dependent flavin oxidoreductase YrpB (nitropropane dioxygenase family)
MYPCSNPELVAAAAEGGGLAIMQPVSLTYVHGWDLREGKRYMRTLTDKPIGFNALIEKGSKKYLEKMNGWIDIALEVTKNRIPSSSAMSIQPFIFSKYFLLPFSMRALNPIGLSVRVRM